jgi:hypothetical protein
MDTLRNSPQSLFNYIEAAAYCGPDTRYFTNQHKERPWPGLREAEGAPCVLHP